MTSRRIDKSGSSRSDEVAQQPPRGDRPPPKGRAGAIAAAAGYDLQDTYVALQLAGLLLQDREPVLEVMWEKKALDCGDGHAEPVHVDDLVLRTQEREVFVQVKASAERWSAARLRSTGVLEQFWRQWHVVDPSRRDRIGLRLASVGDLSQVRDLADEARRARTPAELLAQATEAVHGELRVIADALSLAATSPALRDFLRVIDVEPLQDVAALGALLVRSLTVFGARAPTVADRLLRLVAESKHSGPKARSAHTRATLIARLQEDAACAEALKSTGVLEAGLPRLVVGSAPRDLDWAQRWVTIAFTGAMVTAVPILIPGTPYRSYLEAVGIAVSGVAVILVYLVPRLRQALNALRRARQVAVVTTAPLDVRLAELFPNLITATRPALGVACAAALIYGLPTRALWLYSAGLASDVLDGMFARALKGKGATAWGKNFDAYTDATFNFVSGSGIIWLALFPKPHWASVVAVSSLAVLFLVRRALSRQHSLIAKFYSGAVRVVLFFVLWGFLPAENRWSGLAAGLTIFVFGGFYELLVSVQDLRVGRRSFS